MAYQEKIHDNHTLYVKCGVATVDQIRESFLKALKDYETENKLKLDCRFKVNRVEDKNGNSFGIAFVFITSSEVYHMLLGKNPNGSDRVDYIDDPSWHPIPENSKINESGWSSTVSKSWADQVEEEDEIEKKENMSKCPQIPIQLDSLMKLPSIKMSEEQIKLKREKIIEDNQGKEDFNPDIIEIPEYIHLGIDRAIASNLESKFMHNILKCINIPVWVSKEVLKAEFTPYATDSKTVHERFVKGRKIEETYPFININEDRVGFIIFDPRTHDGRFALHMMKKTYLVKKDKDGNILDKATLIFNHSYRTDRDLMSDINQKPKPYIPKQQLRNTDRNVHS